GQNGGTGLDNVRAQGDVQNSLLALAVGLVKGRPVHDENMMLETFQVAFRDGSILHSGREVPARGGNGQGSMTRNSIAREPVADAGLKMRLWLALPMDMEPECAGLDRRLVQLQDDRHVPGRRLVHRFRSRPRTRAITDDGEG